MNKFSFFLKISFFKTIRFNVHYFGLKHIFRPKIIISKNTKLLRLKGKINYASKKKSHIGFSYNLINYGTKNNTIIYIDKDATIDFDGHFTISKGCSLIVEQNAVLKIGDGFFVSQNSKIECCKNINIGSNVIFSWNVLLMDSDMHVITSSGKIMNKDADIKICNNVWVCCDCFISKGVFIPNNSIIAAKSKVTKKLSDSNCIYANNTIVRRNVDFKM